MNWGKSIAGASTIFFMTVLAGLFLSTSVSADDQLSQTGTTPLNATISEWLDIVPSKQLSTHGVKFGSVDPGTNNTQANNNTGGPGGTTGYNLTLDPASNINMNVTHRLQSSLPAGVQVQERVNLTENVNGYSTNTTLTTSFTAAGNSSKRFKCQGITLSGSCDVRFDIDVANATTAGSVDATYEFCGKDSTDSTVTCS